MALITVLAVLIVPFRSVLQVFVDNLSVMLFNFPLQTELSKLGFISLNCGNINMNIMWLLQRSWTSKPEHFVAINILTSDYLMRIGVCFIYLYSVMPCSIWKLNLSKGGDFSFSYPNRPVKFLIPVIPENENFLMYSRIQGCLWK